MMFKYKIQNLKTGDMQQNAVDIGTNDRDPLNLELEFLRMLDSWNTSSETFKFWRTYA